MMLIDPFRFRGSGPVECEYLGVIDPDGGGVGLVKSVPDVPLGDAAPWRLIVCAAHWFSEQPEGSVSVSGATIAGVSATVHGQGSVASGLGGVTSECGVAIFSAVVPTGATATVEVTYNADVALVYLGTWRLVNVVSVSPYDETTATGPSSVLNTTCDVKKDGALILAGMCIADSDPPVSASGVTQDYATSSRGAGGSLETTADETAHPMSTEFGDALAGADIHVSVAVSFR